MSDFRDFYTETRQAQEKLADKLAKEITRAIPAEVKSIIQKDGLDAMRLSVKANALKFIRGYTTCLVCSFLFSGDFSKQKIPVCDLKTLCRRYEIDFGFASGFIKRLTKRGTVIPTVGRVGRKQLIVPDRAGLEEWRRFRQNFDKG